MKVFVSTDMEGTAGVVDWSQCRGPSQEYEYYRGQLQAEVNAAIDGAVAAGATEFLVNDSHSTMQNLRPDELHGRASYLSGRHKPLYMMEGLDDSFDAALFVSYHGAASSTSSVLITRTTPGPSPKSASTARSPARPESTHWWRSPTGFRWYSSRAIG